MFIVEIFAQRLHSVLFAWMWNSVFEVRLEAQTQQQVLLTLIFIFIGIYFLTRALCNVQNMLLKGNPDLGIPYN